MLLMVHWSDGGLAYGVVECVEGKEGVGCEEEEEGAGEGVVGLLHQGYQAHVA